MTEAGTFHFTVVDVEQRTPEWMAARLGRLTGSAAHNILAYGKDNKELAARKNYRMQLILERLTGKSEGSTFQSEAMRQGIEREPDAIAAYEAATGLLIDRCGFLTHNDLMAGASLDGHLDNFDRLVSVKCRQPAAHWEFLRFGTVPKDAWTQMCHELWLTGAHEHHYVSFNPDFPEHLQLKWIVYPRDKFDIPAYDIEATGFLEGVATELRMLQGWKVVA